MFPTRFGLNTSILLHLLIYLIIGFLFVFLVVIIGPSKHFATSSFFLLMSTVIIRARLSIVIPSLMRGVSMISHGVLLVSSNSVMLQMTLTAVVVEASVSSFFLVICLSLEPMVHRIAEEFLFFSLELIVSLYSFLLFLQRIARSPPNTRFSSF